MCELAPDELAMWLKEFGFDATRIDKTRALT